MDDQDEYRIDTACYAFQGELKLNPGPCTKFKAISVTDGLTVSVLTRAWEIQMAQIDFQCVTGFLALCKCIRH